MTGFAHGVQMTVDLLNWKLKWMTKSCAQAVAIMDGFKVTRKMDVLRAKCMLDVILLSGSMK